MLKFLSSGVSFSLPIDTFTRFSFLSSCANLAFNKEENEIRLKEFLKENKNFEIIDIGDKLPPKLRHSTTKDGYVTFYPNVDGIDGFFIAKMKRCS